MFVDRVRVFAQAGNGGRGCVSFRREKFVPKGGPDGGDGGRGGEVILCANQHTDHLAGLYYEPLIKGRNGAHGQGKKMHGKNAPAKIVHVPVGTIVYRLPDPRLHQEIEETMGEEASSTLPDSPAPDGQPREGEGEFVADLTAPDERFVLCQGGKGGKGNVHFKSSRNRAPRQYTDGGEGESGHFRLELHTIADAALVGYPNAGKSTLIRQLSAAQPKVAPYPFTTLHPIIGVVELNDYKRITVADIPGLVEGAHRNVGLGHDFLRHVTRCRLFAFVLDMAGSEGRNPVADLEALRREIDLYDKRLSQRPWFVVANKMDLPEAAAHLQDFRVRFPQLALVEISASNGRGIEELKATLERRLEQKTSTAPAISSDIVPATA